MGDPSRPADQSLPAEPQDPRVDAALHDYLERVDRGEKIDPEKFVATHPEIAGELRSLIEAEAQLRKFAGADRTAAPGGRADSDPDASTRSFALHGQETIAPQAQPMRPGGGDEGRLKEQFGRYRIVRVLGQGAMGTVYLAEDTQLKRQVALKTPHFEKDPTGELLERLYREARAAATLRHPNICPVYDVGEIDGTHYISMAYIEGHPLSAFVRSNKRQPERQILIVIRKLAQALQEAHDHKIVHRDLKPANIMVDKRGEPLIMDFGLARHARPDEDVRLTHSGMLVGTPAYMAPEQVDADPTKIGPATDQYSLGVILYELLTGQLPFRGSMMAVLGQIVTKEAPAPGQSREGLDPRIDAICLRMMAKNAADRFPSLSAVADELATILKNPVPGGPSPGQSTAGSARAKTDEITFLLAGIDEAVRLEDGRTALKKAEALLKIKPGHHRAIEVQEQFSGEGEGSAVRIGRQVANLWKEGGWVPWSALAFGLAVVGVVSGVIIWWVNGTAIIIKTDDPNIRVEIQGQEAIVTVPGKQKVRVQPGNGEITLTYEGLETLTKSFSIKSGETKILNVSIADEKIVAAFEGEIIPSASGVEKAKNVGNLPGESQPSSPSSVKGAAPGVVARAAQAGDGFVSLFNGKDLTSWRAHSSQPGNWRVEKGVLIGSGEGSDRSDLYTERGDFKDFHLRVEARINAGGKSGIYFRSTSCPARPYDNPQFPYGYAAQIDSSVDLARTGSLRAGGEPVVEFTDALVPPGEWFTEEVIAQGNHFVVKVNGQTTAVYRDEKEISASGHIALQQNNPKTVAEFRKIEIKELPAEAVAEAPVVSADGYVSLFNGKNLRGWTTDLSRPWAWHVENGILTGGPAGEASFLYSDRDNYKNFRLRIEARLKDNQYSGLWARTQIPPEEAVSRTPTTGYKVELREPSDRRTPRTGSIWAVTERPEGGPSYNGFARQETMIQPERWFTLEVVAQGKRVDVLVNGESASNTNWARRDQYESGRIALQQHVGKPSIEFRKIEIKELADSVVAPVAAGKKPTRPADKDPLVAPFDEDQAHVAQQKWADRLRAPVELVNKIDMRLRLIPPGQFEMGSDHGLKHVAPAHTVRITRPFYLGTYEVTRGQFARFVAATHFKTHAEYFPDGWRLDNISHSKHEAKTKYTWRKPGFAQDDNHPVVHICVDDAVQFCNWLSRTEGKTYRLPTEAEWEYACRAGTTTWYYNGDRRENLTEIANVADAKAREVFPAWTVVDSSDGWAYSSPVGSFRPNAFGLYDMLGNVAEWCSDWYDSYQSSPVDDPRGPTNGQQRTVRGGSFATIPDATTRWHMIPDHRFPDIGFRVVCEIPNAAPVAAPSSNVAAPGALDNRRVWVGEHRFENIAAGKWLETSPTNPNDTYHFEEVTRTPQYVELFRGLEQNPLYRRDKAHPTPGCRIRLEDSKVLIIHGLRDKEWRHLYNGHWVTESSAAVPVHRGIDRSFFNARDLTGWRGLSGYWRVKDGAIVGSTVGRPKAHTFLCSTREYKDFELTFRARLAGGVGNTGVQFRSKLRDEKTFWLVGPQCEICVQDRNRKYPTGSLITEPTGEPSVAPAAAIVDRVFKLADFNDFEIRCIGQHVQIKVNGLTTVDADFPSMPDEGLIGWQIHGKNPPREVTFKDIEFIDLSAPPTRVGGL